MCLGKQNPPENIACALFPIAEGCVQILCTHIIHGDRETFRTRTNFFRISDPMDALFDLGEYIEHFAVWKKIGR
jgi:hypothetical protein